MANTDCEKILNLVPLYIDNCLSEDDTHIVSRHLSSCDACKKEYEFLLSLMNTAVNLEETDPSTDFHKKLMEKANDLKIKKRAKRIVLLKRGSAGVAAAAVVALCIVSFGNIEKNTDIELPEYASSSVSDDITARTAEEKTSDPAPKNAPVQQKTAPTSSPPVEVISQDNSENPPSGGGSSAISDTQTESTPTVDEPLLISEPLSFTVADISPTDETYDAVMEILVQYEKDAVGYIIPDIDSVLQQIAKLDIEVKTRTTTEYTHNYIILEQS